jgi:hypothetical protein
MVVANRTAVSAPGAAYVLFFDLVAVVVRFSNGCVTEECVRAAADMNQWLAYWLELLEHF